jgi:NitT/TauT family transport system permease protein
MGQGFLESHATDAGLRHLNEGRSMNPLAHGLRSTLPIALFGALLVLWYFAVVLFDVPQYILPNPKDVATALFAGEVPWLAHSYVTLAEILVGFLLSGVAGVLLGIVIAWSVLISTALMPLLVFINTLPKVALAPLMLLWLGYGIIPNALIAALIGFFPVVINTTVGLSQTPRDMLDLGRVFGAPKWKVFLKIRIPGALPYILGALKVSATTCVVGAIVGEFIAAQRGLGAVIINTQTTLNTPVAFAAIIWISILGLMVYAVVGWVGRWLAPWAEGVQT